MKTWSRSWLINDPEVYQYQGWQVPFSRDLGEDFIQTMKLSTPGAEGRWFQTALEHKGDHVLVGDIGFFPVRGNARQAYFGFTLARPYWNQGYASEAARALISYIFDELCLHRLMADCDTENLNSYRLLERLGFRREGHHVESYWLGERWGDEYVYALLDREWKSLSS